MGCSQFHSSFLPKVVAAARKHGVSARRLVVAMGKFDPVNLDDENLNRIAGSLPKAARGNTRDWLTSFSVPGISAHSISSSLSAVQSLVDGMVVTCAKRRARPVLELVASESSSDSLVLADLVLAEGPVVLGRVVYGSFDVLEQVLRMTSGSIPLFLNDKDGGAWGAQWPARLVEIVGAERVLPVRSKRLIAGYIEDVLTTAAHGGDNFCLLIYGSPHGGLLQRCCENFTNVVVHGELPQGAPGNCWQMSDFSDRMHFDLGVGIALLLCPPSAADSASIDQLMLPEGIAITTGRFPRFEMESRGRALIRLDLNQAYRGQMERWVAISNLMKSTQTSAVAAQ
jgi:hypothetical protein